MDINAEFFNVVLSAMDGAPNKMQMINVLGGIKDEDKPAAVERLEQSLANGWIVERDDHYYLPDKGKSNVLSFEDMVASEVISYNDTAGIYQRITDEINTLSRRYLMQELQIELRNRMPKEDPAALSKSVWGLAKKRKYRQQLTVGIATANDGRQYQFIGPKNLKLVGNDQI